MSNPLLDRFRGSNDDSDRSTQRSASKQPSQPPPHTRDGVVSAKSLRATPPSSAENQPPLTAARVGSIAEQRIQAAMDEGMFDNLEGAGKPLDLYDDMHIRPDMRMAFRLMKGQNIGAPWVEVQRAYESELNRFQVWRTNVRARWTFISESERLELLAELHQRINALNTIIHSLNALVPTDTMRVGLVVYNRELHFLEHE